MSVPAVKQNGLLDHALADDLREKIDVRLGRARACCHVVKPGGRIFHPLPPGARLYQNRTQNLLM
jgi:hypothetical protein